MHSGNWGLYQLRVRGRLKAKAIAVAMRGFHNMMRAVMRCGEWCAAAAVMG